MNWRYTMRAQTYEACMTCHYNVHSNVQATNTNYTGGGTQPPDGDSHLITSPRPW